MDALTVYVHAVRAVRVCVPCVCVCAVRVCVLCVCAYRACVRAADRAPAAKTLPCVHACCCAGSRPARRRKDTAGVNELRAIPWQFAWTQTRLILPAWLGIGEAVLKAIREVRMRGPLKEKGERTNTQEEDGGLCGGWEAWGVG